MGLSELNHLLESLGDEVLLFLAKPPGLVLVCEELEGIGSEFLRHGEKICAELLDLLIAHLVRVLEIGRVVIIVLEMVLDRAIDNCLDILWYWEFFVLIPSEKHISLILRLFKLGCIMRLSPRFHFLSEYL